MAARVVPFAAATEDDGSSPQAPQRQWHGLHNYRCKRKHEIPGWFDRWDFFDSDTSSSRSGTTPTTPTTTQTPATDACIVVWGIACHVSALTALVALLVFVSPIAHVLHYTTPLGDPNNLVAPLYVAVGAALERLVLKLVLDRPRLRVAVFTVYTTTIALLVASMILAFRAPYVVLCLGLMTSGWWIQYLLLRRLQCGKSYTGFWNTTTIAIVRLLIVSGGLLGLLLLYDIPGDHNAQQTFAIGLASELLLSSLAWVEVTLLCRTLAPEDAFLGVYFLHLDLLAGGVMQPVLYSGYLALRTIVKLCKWLWIALDWLSFLPWMCLWFDPI